MDSHNDYPRTLIGNYMAGAQETHANAVKAYAERLQAKRDAEKQAEEDKIKAKIARKEARAAKRKAAAVAALREEIETKFVTKV